MIHKAESFFSHAESEKIKNAIVSSEKSTSGEIVVMVVDESDPYYEAATFGAFVLSSLVALVAMIFFTVLTNYQTEWSYSTKYFLSDLILRSVEYASVWIFIPLLVVCYYPCRLLLLRFSRIKNYFVSEKHPQLAVYQRAVQAFYEKGLYRTRDETGVLIFISLLERRVWILGDKGIHARIGDAFWKARAAELSKGMKDNNYCDEICNVITKCGQELTKHFPIKLDDKNELPDEVVS
jgi:putative membrane protein